jgi:enoyl-CoA hydratase
MIASAMDMVFADRSAQFLAGLVEYYSIPWDVGVRKAKELLFESRFIDADEAHALGFVNRVHDAADLERETMAYCQRVAENTPLALRMAKIATNRTQDIQGYTNAVDAAFADYVVMMSQRGGGRVEGMRRLGGVDLAVKGLRKERFGLQ